MMFRSHCPIDFGLSIDTDSAVPYTNEQEHAGSNYLLNIVNIRH